MPDPATPTPPDEESISVLEAVASLADGVRIEDVAEVAGTTPMGLAIAAIQWLAQHRDDLTDAQHSYVCRVLATALAPR